MPGGSGQHVFDGRWQVVVLVRTGRRSVEIRWFETQLRARLPFSGQPPVGVTWWKSGARDPISGRRASVRPGSRSSASTYRRPAHRRFDGRDDRVATSDKAEPFSTMRRSRGTDVTPRRHNTIAAVAHTPTEPGSERKQINLR
jgi:hypothetical protein